MRMRSGSSTRSKSRTRGTQFAPLLAQLSCPESRLMELDTDGAKFYREVLHSLNSACVPYLIGGGCAFTRYTGIDRPLKDFDIFIVPAQCPRVIDVLSSAGFP